MNSLTSNSISQLYRLTSCIFYVQGAPRGGSCQLQYTGTDVLPEGCNAMLMDTAAIACSDWKTGCSIGPIDFTFTLQKKAFGETSSTVNLQSRKSDLDGNTATPFQVTVGSNTGFSIRVCSSTGACDKSTIVNVQACSTASVERRIELVQNALLDSQICMNEQNIECAQNIQTSLAEFADSCTDDKNDPIVDLIIPQTVGLTQIYSTAQGSMAEDRILTDITPLLDLYAMIGGKSCNGSDTMFNLLPTLCLAENFSPEVGAVALNNLYQKQLMRANGTTDVDQALRISSCLQESIREEKSICGSQNGVLYEGTAYDYYMFNIPIADLDAPTRTVIETPNLTLSLPPQFIDQIAMNLEGTEITESELLLLPCISIHIATAVIADACIGSICEEGVILGSDGVSGVDFYLEGRVKPIPLELSHVTDTIITLLQGRSVNKKTGLKKKINEDIFNGTREELEVETRFQLTEDQYDENSLCAYYVGEGIFVKDCKFLYSEESPNGNGLRVHCDCPHFSNFGVLFDGNGSSDGWTTYRIISISLLAAAWFVIVLLMALVTFSTKFQIAFGFETSIRKASRVLGDEGL